MKHILSIISIGLVLIATSLKAQNISINSGMYSYRGDLEKAKDIKSVTNWQFGYGLSVAKQFKNGIEIRANFNKYALAQNEVKVDSNLNFKTAMMEFSGSFLYHIDNDIFLNKTSKISPYLGFGVGTISYETSYDYLDASGNKYHYWQDGSIRDQEENYDNIFTSNKIRRDYNYETFANNKGSSIIIPLILGTDFKTGNKLYFGIESRYYISMIDLLDNYALGSNDSYYYLGFTAEYNIKAKTENKINNSNYKGMRFGKIDKLDQDNDGVIDTKDLCQFTKKGVEVDDNGCPLDKDKDFVWDYKDKELNSVDTAVVTVDGITITDKHFQIMYMLYLGDIFPVEKFFMENFQYIPMLLRKELAELVNIDTKSTNFKTLPEDIKNGIINSITIIGTEGDKSPINRKFTSSGEAK